MNEKNWTLAYRNASEPVIHRVTDWAGTWGEASDAAHLAAGRHPDLSVWYVPSRAAELAGFVSLEDIARLLIDEGEWLPLVDDAVMQHLS